MIPPSPSQRPCFMVIAACITAVAGWLGGCSAPAGDYAGASRLHDSWSMMTTPKDFYMFPVSPDPGANTGAATANDSSSTDTTCWPTATKSERRHQDRDHCDDHKHDHGKDKDKDDKCDDDDHGHGKR